MMNFSSSTESRRELTVTFASEEVAGQGRAIRSAGREALLIVGEDGARVCIPRSTPHVCVTETNDGRDGGDSPKRASRIAEKRALAYAAQLRFAPSMTDRSTWFDAEDALPH